MADDIGIFLMAIFILVLDITVKGFVSKFLLGFLLGIEVSLIKAYLVAFIIKSIARIYSVK